ncbi:Mrp/NBP35 family ATP-binding protein [Pseudolysinimonas kribbensis]|uniref:Iron-sulfur cluster carrier protein n=1 Tax=Pseudolysinimonas kribbensis TaxID=433641 RepID=A0ABQ6K6N3_9MICO|nr:P-loop NTPase [Pseudolysinimonas kribbensis]GMA96300.1 iron-sulfur cluster carrier protein [Pseudolysinimonas kribbensis]
MPASDPLWSALARVQDPEIRRPITELDMVRDAVVDEGVARIDLRLTIVGCPAADRIERDVRAAASGVDGVTAVDLTIGVMTPVEREALVTRLRGVRPQQFGPDTLTKIFAITSGKGGVGKSTLTANLAVALAAPAPGGPGLRVGLVDADVFGFSIPGILGVTGAVPTRVGDMILPPIAHGVKVISIGMFVEPSTAVSWRGPLLHRTLQQFLTDVWFGDLDVLLLDLPPGTGDIAISLGQLLPHAEVVVVTTPQPAAAEVAERSGLVARQTGQTVIGVVENMSGGVFGSGGGERLAERLGVPMLATVPLSGALREDGDAGSPAVLAHPSDPASLAIAQLAASLATRARGLAGRPLPFRPR